MVLHPALALGTAVVLQEKGTDMKMLHSFHIFLRRFRSLDVRVVQLESSCEEPEPS